MIETFDSTLMKIALGGLAVSGLLFAAAFAAPYVKAAWDRASKFARAVFCCAVVCACLFGGAKHKTGGISYPKTDNEIAYLTDAGSYVTNDAVHVAFTRLPMVPSSATFYLDYCALDGTNEQGVATNWVNAKTATFGELEVPFDFAFANATNYNWLAYTDWTPGPAVQTNGVWHAYWGLDRKQGRYFIPVRTCVRDGGSVIATPKSKWDNAPKTPDDYVQDGLVAMWDGEWNAGRGVHDPNATNWVDLVGGKMLTLSGNLKQLCADNTFSVYIDGVKYEVTVRCDWEDNALLSTNNCEEMYGKVYSSHNYDALLSVSCFVGDPLYEVLSNQYCTIEAGFSGGPGSGRWYTPVGWVFYGLRNSGITPSTIGTPVTLYHDGRKYFVSETFQDGKVTVLVNNTKSSTTTISPCSAQNIQGFFMGGTRYSPITHNRTYCLRIYNRPLTAAEIAHNYEIDKARFGSGNE